MKSRLIALAVVVCAGLVLAAGASAGGAPYATQVTIKEQNGDFNGKVKSNSACIADRTVTVFKKRKGRPDKKINSDTTDELGRWNTGNTHVGKGKYYAKAKRVPLEKMKKGSLLCKGGKSKIVTVG